MSEAALQSSLSDEDQNKIPVLDDTSSQLYEKLNPVLELFSDRLEVFNRPEVFLDHLFDQIRSVINPDLLLLFGWDEENQEWPLISQSGLPKHLIKNGTLARAWQSLPTIVLHEKGPLFSDDIAKDRRFIGQVIRAIGVHTFTGITLRSKERVYGSLSIGFYAPEALRPSDQTAFLMMSKLLPPFLFEQTRPQKEETGPITLSLDLSSRIKDCSVSFLDLVACKKDQVENANLSQFLTKSGYGKYLSSLKRLKAEGDLNTALELEVDRKGGRRRLILAQMELVKKDEKVIAVALTAEDITQIVPLETELVYKNGLKLILERIFSALYQATHHPSSETINEDQILKEALEAGFSRFGIEGGCFLRLSTEKKKLQLIADRGLSTHQQSQLEKHGIGAKEHLLWKIIEKDEPFMMVAKSQRSSLKKRLLGDGGLVSFMGVPVESEGCLWGTLSFFSRETIFTEIDLNALITLGKELGLVVDQVKSFAILQKRIEMLKTLNEVGHSITKSLHLDQLLASIANNLKKMINASNCYIFLEDGKRHLYYGATASDQRSDAVRKFEIKMNENQLIPITVRERHPFVIENAAHEPSVGRKWIRTFKSRSLLSVPLVNRDRVVGVLLLDETRYFRKFTSEEVQMVSEMAEQVSIGIENAMLHHAVSRHRERLQTLSSAIVNIQEEERRRVAKKLRQDVTGALATVQKNLVWIKGGLENPSVKMADRIEEAQNETTKVMEVLKVLSAEMRPAILDESGLVSTIKSVVKTFEEQSSAKVHLQINGAIKRLPARIEILLFRIIQEALSNISSHAKAESVVVSLDKRDPYIHLYVTDDGKGFDVKRYFSSPQLTRKEIGILGMKERVELSGGTFYIDSHPGQGTRISIRIPVVRRGQQS